MTCAADPRPLRLGVLVSSLSRRAGGLFESVRNLSLALRVQGVDVSVFGVGDEDTERDIGHWEPLVPRIFIRHGPRAFAYAPQMACALDAANLDLLHLHGLWTYTSVATWRWQRRTGRPVFISPRGMLDGWALANSGMKKHLALAAYEGRNLRGACALHALNESEARSISRVVPGKPVVVLPNAVNLPPPSRFRRERGAGTRKVALFLGRIHPKKGVGELIDAWAIARAAAPDLMAGWHLDIAGWDDGGYLAALERRRLKLGLEDDVAFIGPVYGAEKAAALASAEVFILPSYSEGLPMSVLEAWSYEMPVLMTEFCNLEPGFAARAALHIDPAPETLAKQLVAHLSTPDLAGYGRRGRTLVERQYTWPGIAEKMAAAYRWAARGEAPPESFFRAEHDKKARVSTV